MFGGLLRWFWGWGGAAVPPAGTKTIIGRLTLSPVVTGTLTAAVDG